MCEGNPEGCEAAFGALVRSAGRVKGFSGWFLRAAGPGVGEEGTAENPLPRWIRESDPPLPVVFEGVLPGGGLPEGRLAGGYVALDPTPISIPARPLDLIGLWADRLAATEGPGVRTIGMPQAFGGWPIAHRVPTYTEIRAMAYLAIVHGARGIIFREFSSLRPAFDRSDAAWDIRKSPEIWERLPALTGELRRLSPWFLRPPEPADTIVSDRPEAIDRRVWRDGETATVVAVNVDDEEIESRFSLGTRFAGEVEVLFEERVPEDVDGGFTDRFLPHETHVYRLRGVSW